MPRDFLSDAMRVYAISSTLDAPVTNIRKLLEELSAEYAREATVEERERCWDAVARMKNIWLEMECPPRLGENPRVPARSVLVWADALMSAIRDGRRLPLKED